MFELSGEGIIISSNKYGEDDLIIKFLTPTEGMLAGLIKHGQKSRSKGSYGIGNQVSFILKARLEEHLGTVKIEPIKSYSAFYLSDLARLDGICAVCSELVLSLAERDSHPILYQATKDFFEHLATENWIALFIKWEIALLSALGFGLNLTECAITGSTDDLVFVSPKTGRAVSRAAAGKWESMLLPLPSFIAYDTPPDNLQIGEGLALTGYFLQKHIFTRGLPSARTRLARDFTH